MKKTLRTLFCGILLSLPLSGYTQEPYKPNLFKDSTFVLINLNLSTIDPTLLGNETHRTPPLIPTIYKKKASSILYFENPCYECTLELVIPGTDTVVYTSAIEDGAETFQIPNGFIGTYELHIHRGNYCFWGEIEL